MTQSKGPRGLLGVALLGIVSSISTAGAADAPNLPSSQGLTQARHQQRLELVEDFKIDLETAKTPQERVAVLEQYRAGVASLTPVPHVATDQPDRPMSEIIAEMKASMASTPEGQARAASLEATWNGVESIRLQVEKLPNASTEARAAILDGLQNEREKLVQDLQATALQTQVKDHNPDANSVLLPPEMQALQAKAEERREEISTLKESIDEATPEERRELLRAWREKREVARSVELPIPQNSPTR